MVLLITLVLLGFAGLIFGANLFLEGAISLAKKTGMSDLMIGLTVVAFGTSAPELVVNTIASFQQHSDIAYGNIIGSNNFNLFVVLGIVGLIAPIKVQTKMVWVEIPISLFAAFLLFLLSNAFFGQETSSLQRIDALVIMLCFAIFIYYLIHHGKKEKASLPLDNQVPTKTLKVVVFLIAGLSLLIIGGKVVVDNAIILAKDLGVSEKIIGLTIIAAGTSLPELVTSLVAAFKKNSDIAIGNVIGSNIFNLLFIISLSAFVSPIVYNNKFNLDFYFLMGGTLFLFVAMFLSGKNKLDRWEAGLLLSVYLFYIGFQIIQP